MARTQFIGIGLTKREAPFPDRFIGHSNSSLCQKLFNIAKTQGEGKIQPGSVTDNFRWEAVAFVMGSRCWRIHAIKYARFSAFRQVDNTAYKALEAVRQRERG